MPRHSKHFLNLVKRGATVRLQDLIYEAKLLLQLFPDLRDSFDKDELPVSFIMAKGSGRAATRGPRRRRRPMSAARRKAASARMKRYWAARRKTANS
jgi:hypothetical protein